MSIELTVLSSVGGLLIGGVAGYFFKKVLKFAAIAAGAIVMILVALQYYKIVQVDTNQIQEIAGDLAIKTAETLQYMTTQTDTTMILAIPFVSVGFVVGFMKG